LAAKVRAGGTVELQWNSWPESHHGPVIDYLANCNGDCATVGKSALRFFKIGEAGLVDGSSGPGKWASDDLIANNASWSVTIPVSISPGNYVLRHEIIALHSAGHEQGAQNYPQCVNLEVTGDGIESPQGVAGTQLYKATDPGIRFDIYRSMDSYPIPGPPIFRDGDSSPPSSAPPASVPPSAVATETSTETPVPSRASLPVDLPDDLTAYQLLLVEEEIVSRLIALQP
jgi:hypothetical protein